MLLDRKPLDAIVESDLLALINDRVEEQKAIEYKHELPSNKSDDKREFLADVSSLANSAGGHLIFGMREDAGLPVELCGIDLPDTDQVILRLDNPSATVLRLA
jgi:predicted HTH transcriptional regulator